MADRYKITGKFIDNEIITKSDEEIKEAINTSFFPIKMNTITTIDDSKTVTFVIDNLKNESSDKLYHKYLFYYIPSRYVRKSSLEDNTKDYFMNLEKKLEKCLKVENTYKWLEILINRVDKLEIKEKNTFFYINLTDVTKLPRYKKMMRLKKFYSNLIMFILITFQDYYFEDFINQETIPELMEDAFLKILNPFLRLKELFEEFVHNEFPDDKITDVAVGELNKKKKN